MTDNKDQQTVFILSDEESIDCALILSVHFSLEGAMEMANRDLQERLKFGADVFVNNLVWIKDKNEHDLYPYWIAEYYKNEEEYDPEEYNPEHYYIQKILVDDCRLPDGR